MNKSHEKRTAGRPLILASLALLVTMTASFIATVQPPPTRTEDTEKQLTSDAADDVDPVFSPDGKRIVFSSNRSGSFDIWIMDADGRHQTRLTFMSGDERYPKFSLDGRKISFLEVRQGETDVWVINADGSELINLTNDAAMEGCFEWSPVSDHLVYDSNKGGLWNIWMADLQGGSTIQLMGGQGDSRYPSWTPDGRSILFSSNLSGEFKIYMMNTAGKGIRQLTHGNDNDIKPRMSPDGKKIAFVSDRDFVALDVSGVTLESREKGTLWIMNIGDGTIHEAVSNPLLQQPGVPLAPEISEYSYPLWNPKSQGVMYFTEKGYPTTDSDVHVFYQDIPVVEYLGPFVTERRGDSLTAMIFGTADDMFASWKPNGKGVVYSSNRLGNFNIWILELEREIPKAYG